MHLLLEDCQQPSLFVFPDVSTFPFSWVILSLKVSFSVWFSSVWQVIDYPTQSKPWCWVMQSHCCWRFWWFDFTIWGWGLWCFNNSTWQYWGRGCDIFFLELPWNHWLWLVSLATSTFTLNLIIFLYQVGSSSSFPRCLSSILFNTILFSNFLFLPLFCFPFSFIFPVLF